MRRGLVYGCACGAAAVLWTIDQTRESNPWLACSLCLLSIWLPSLLVSQVGQLGGSTPLDIAEVNECMRRDEMRISPTWLDDRERVEASA